MKFDLDTADARLLAISSSIGPSPTLKLRTGTQPSACSDADSGVVIASITLPAIWLEINTQGTIEKVGSWVAESAVADGRIGHYRLYDSLGACRIQGSASGIGLGGDMEIDNPDVLTGQQVTVSTFSITESNV